MIGPKELINPQIHQFTHGSNYQSAFLVMTTEQKRRRSAVTSALKWLLCPTPLRLTLSPGSTPQEIADSQTRSKLERSTRVNLFFISMPMGPGACALLAPTCAKGVMSIKADLYDALTRQP